MEPEDIIRTYHEAVNQGDNRRAYTCLTRKALSQYLFRNMDGSRIFNSDFQSDDAGDGLYNLASARVVSVGLWEEMPKPHAMPKERDAGHGDP